MDLDRPFMISPHIEIPNATKYITILNTPLISLNTRIPQAELTKPGPADPSGMLTARERLSFATNMPAMAMPHMMPDRRPGMMALG